MRHQILTTLIVALALSLFTPSGLAAQQNAPENASSPHTQATEERGAMVFGTIISVGVDRIEIKKRDGSTQIVQVDDSTRYQQGEQEIQLEDLKSGHRVFVRGQLSDNKELVAFVVRRVREEERARFQDAGERAFGEIVSIDKSQLKLRNRVQGERTVVVNEQTVFLKEGQPIRLKDLRMGDRVVAFGKESDGRFVATRIIIGEFRGRFQRVPAPGEMPHAPEPPSSRGQEPNPHE